MVLPTGSTRKGRIQRLPQAFRCNGIPQGSMALLLVFRALPHRRPRRRTEPEHHHRLRGLTSSNDLDQMSGAALRLPDGTAACAKCRPLGQPVRFASSWSRAIRSTRTGTKSRIGLPWNCS